MKELGACLVTRPEFVTPAVAGGSSEPSQTPRCEAAGQEQPAMLLDSPQVVAKTASKRRHLFYSRPGGVDGPGKHTWWFRVLVFIWDESTVLDNALGTTCRYFAEEVLPPRLAIFTKWKLVGGYTAKAIGRVLSRCPNLLPNERHRLEREQCAQAACEARHEEARRQWETLVADNEPLWTPTRLDRRAEELCQHYLKSVPSLGSSCHFNDIFEHLRFLQTEGCSPASSYLGRLNKALLKSLAQDESIRRILGLPCTFRLWDAC